MDSILAPNSPRRKFGKVYCRAIADSCCQFKPVYAHEMEIVYFSAYIDPDGVIYTRVLQSFNEKMFLKDACCMLMHDSYSLGNSAGMLRQKDCKGRAAELIHMRYSFRLEEMSISSA